MPQAAGSKLKTRCDRSHQQHIRLNELIPVGANKSSRHALARCAMDLAREHHSAIYHLVNSGHFASSAAMLRPLLEAGTCAHWLVYVAPTNHVRSLVQYEKHKDTPTLQNMLNALAKHGPMPAIKAFAKALPKEGRYLHQFTHGGMEQLSRRKHETTFTESQNVTTLILADLFALVAGMIGTVIYEAPELSAFVGEQRALLACEATNELGAQLVDEPWTGLPPATLVDLWDIAV